MMKEHTILYKKYITTKKIIGKYKDENMKRPQFLAVSFALVISIMATDRSNDAMVVSPNKVTEENDWILLGEAPLSNYYQEEDIITAKLYVREIATKIICRVEYQGKYHATRWDNGLKSYIVTINGKTYKYDIPLDMGNEENENNDNAKLVGKWGFSSDGDWYIDISYSNGEYKFFLNPYSSINDGEIVEQHTTATEFIYTKKQETDHRPQMRSKGWSYMYDDCDKNADIGYPKTGQYKYDTDILYSTISVSLTGVVPTYCVRKFHSYYYYQGSLTYVETEILSGSGTKLVRK